MSKLLKCIFLSMVHYEILLAKGDSEYFTSRKNVTVSTAKEAINISEPILESFKRCFTKGDIVECLRDQTMITMENALDDNETWYLNEYISLEPNPNFILENETLSRQTEDGTIMSKFSDLLKSRRLQLQTDLMPVEGRKKKHRKKQGGIFMMSGLTMAAIFAQVVLGKVAFLAAIALIIAKIALFISTTTSFKNKVTAGTTANHVTYSDHGSTGPHGGSFDGGYQRSYYRPNIMNPYQYEDVNELSNRDIELEGI